MNKVAAILETIESLQKALLEEQKRVTAEAEGEEGISDLVENSTAGELSARYWLMEFLEPLTRKELKSIIDGFMIQMINDEQAKRLVKFLLVRYPSYYNKESITAAD